MDGGFCDGNGSFGGVMRSEEGAWILGYRGSSNAEVPLHAEIIAIKMSGGRIIIETDSSTVDCSESLTGSHLLEYISSHRIPLHWILSSTITFSTS